MVDEKNDQTPKARAEHIVDTWLEKHGGGFHEIPYEKPLMDFIAQALHEAEQVAYEKAARTADMWGNGDWRVADNGRKLFDLHALQVQVNCTGRAIAEGIRALKETETET